MNRSREEEYDRGVGLGEWTLPPSIDPVVMKRELEAVKPYEAYATEGGLLADLEQSSSVLQGIKKAIRKRKNASE